MVLAEKFLTFYYPATSSNFDFKQQRDQRLFVAFLSISQIVTLFFIPLNLLTGLTISAKIDSVALIILITISLFYKFTAKFEISFFAYILCIVIFTSGMHLIAPPILYGNILWLLPFLFFSFMIFSTAYRYWLLAIGITFFSLATAIPVIYPDFPQEVATPISAMVTNIATIIFSAIASAVIAVLTITEESRVKSFLQKQKKYFENLNSNNAILTSMITHDIANPLMLTQHLLKKDHLTSDNIEKMIVHLEQISAIISNARQLKALKDGKLKLTLSPVDLHATCVTCIENMQDISSNKEITLQLNSQDQRYRVFADENSLQVSVINNILSNAIKFSQHKQKIELSLTKAGTKTILVVRDYGVGIPRKIIPNLFDFTQQTSRNGTDGEVGTGFGLPLVKIFMEIYNGSVEVRSRTRGKNQGTKFTLTFTTAPVMEKAD